MALEIVQSAPVERLAYKPAAAAKLLGIGRSRVFELMHTGELASVKYGRTRLISRRAIERFLKIDEAQPVQDKAA